MSPGGHQLLDEARAGYEAGDFRTSREAALAGLGDRPDDVALLRLAGRASLELGLDEAADYLEQAVALDPKDAQTWLDLGDARISEGRPELAGEAFQRALQLRPDDTVALVNLAHTSYVVGKVEEAVTQLRQVADRDPAIPAGLRSLVDLLRREGRAEEALEAAKQLARVSPGDVEAVLDVAELTLELGRLDEAGDAFARLRSFEDDPQHEVYAYHGMIEAEIGRGRWRHALDLAVDATRLDRLSRTTDVLAFIVARVFGESERPSPSQAEIEEALARSRAEHRLLHSEALVV